MTAHLLSLGFLPVTPAPMTAVSIGGLIGTYGYWAVLLLVGAESLGVPVPGETALIAAGIYAGNTHRLSPWTIFAVAAIGAIVGDNIGYEIGRQGGYRLAKRYGHVVRLDARKLKTARYLFDRHGPVVVFFGRFVSVLRTYAAFLAGTSKMAWPRFVASNAAGGIVWAAIYTAASYLAGAAVSHLSTPIAVGAGVVIAGVVVTLIVVARRRSGELADRAEAAYPGPLE